MQRYGIFSCYNFADCKSCYGNILYLCTEFLTVLPLICNEELGFIGKISDKYEDKKISIDILTDITLNCLCSNKD